MIRVYFWRIEKKWVLWAISRMALDRISLWRTPGISFWKLLGTGKGETFTPRDADAQRWGLLIVIDPNELSKFEDSALLKRWSAKATSEYVVELSPISIHGEWSGKKPFAYPSNIPANWQGKVVAITRARIKWRKNLIFWRSVPPVTKSLHNSPGLTAAIGIGEAPIGLQGTFSVWESGEAVRNFAYRGEAHKEAIAATHRENWYAEEMFARFAVTKEVGSL
ncbi:MAG: spheroidene monooxygenase [Candidatus Nanopelagicaceae bacterium]|nr:spheroidene monooxygenase [Candidatus Nanopelagicaceae bacterium]